MASASDVKFCLIWETERPYIGRSRKSSFFRMSGEEFYLCLYLEKNTLFRNLCSCSVWLFRRGGGDISKSAIAMADCIVVSETQTFFRQSALLVKNPKSGYNLFSCSHDKSQFSPQEHSKNWRVICHIRCSAEPLSLQINNKTIHLTAAAGKSVDRGVQVSPEVPSDTESLLSDISGLLEEEIFPDFRLECGGRVFPVHRSILAARSEVFRAMFRNRMLESETGSTRIEDLEAPVLESLLKFVYSGKLDQVSEDTLPKIYEASDRYAVHSLRTACCHLMKRNLTEENCVSSLEVAESHCDRDLRAAAVSFIVENPAVLKSATWMAYSVTHLETAREVLQNYVSATMQKGE